jgi:molybdate transport system permease protein
MSRNEPMREEHGVMRERPRVGDPTAAIAGPRSSRWEQRWRGLGRWLPLALASLPMLLFLLVPLLALVLRTDFSRLVATMAGADVAPAIQLSIVTTFVALGIVLLAGTPLAYLLARRRFPGRAVIETLLDLPIVLPPAVAGIALLFTFGRFTLIGGWFAERGHAIAFTQAAVILAQLFVAGPFYVKSAQAAFASVDRDLEQAAALDGATPLGVFRQITVPLAAQPLFGGAVMMWARALGEFGATILFAGNLPGRTQTMPLAIYLGFESGDIQQPLALSIVLLVLSFGVLFVVKGLLHRRIEPPPLT